MDLQPTGEEGIERLAGQSTGRAFFALGIELADDFGTGPAADLDALGAAIRELDE